MSDVKHKHKRTKPKLFNNYSAGSPYDGVAICFIPSTLSHFENESGKLALVEISTTATATILIKLSIQQQVVKYALHIQSAILSISGSCRKSQRYLQHFLYFVLTRIKQNDKLSLLLLSTVSLLVLFVLLLMLMLLLSLWLKPLILTVSALVVVVSMMMFVFVLMPDSDAAELAIKEKQVTGPLY
uniref:Uncharacterized protein n=1 Tax=Glossina pallidipes TaxID=7398 RepID=A0A1A9ZF40_GLOPL